MDHDLFANVEPEFRHLAPQAIALLDKCKCESHVEPEKLLPVLISTHAEPGAKASVEPAP